MSVAADGRGLVGHAGAVHLRALADRTGLTGALSVALGRPLDQRLDRGVVFVEVAMMIALGGSSLSDIRIFEHCRAVFGAPVSLENPEEEALAAARALAERLRVEVPECQAGIGVASGQVVAGNVGAKDRFEYTVIGEPVNEAARLCELSKTIDGHLVASSETVARAGDAEGARWTLGETVTLRGHDEPTRLAVPV